MNYHSNCPILALFAFCLIPNLSFAGLISGIDQENLVTVSAGGGAVGISTGQSFIPTLNRIDAVEFSLLTPGASTTLIAQVFSGESVAAGNLLGSSASLVITNQTFEMIHFDLITPVALTPGSFYTVAFLPTAGAAPDFSVKVGGVDSYLQGHFVTTAGPQANIDMVFREGTHAVPEPSSIVLLGLGGIALVGYGARRKQRTVRL